MEVSNAAPVRLSDDISESASKTPIIPPAENEPFHGRHVRAERERRARC